MSNLPILTASGEVIYGETPEDGIVAKVYGDPELARLFASAPELLEALEAMLPEYPRDPVNGCQPTFSQCESARAAIAKARGQ